MDRFFSLAAEAGRKVFARLNTWNLWLATTDLRSRESYSSGFSFD
jgi:hypothetical protein